MRVRKNNTIRKSYSVERRSNRDKAIPNTVMPDRVDSAETTDFRVCPILSDLVSLHQTVWS